jgi:hypothetical protein
MAISFNFPQQTINPGTRTVGPVTVPVGLTHMRIELTISNNTNVNAVTTITFVMGLTTGDKTICSQTFPGGVLLSDGVPLTIQVMDVSNLEEPTNASRTMRAVIVVTGAQAILGPGTLSAY